MNNSLLWALIAVAAAIAMAVVVANFRARKQPPQNQEQRIRRSFQIEGNSRVGIDTSSITLPQDRINEIAAEYGYRFSEHKKTKNGNVWLVYTR